jgi:RNA polymerase sigma factor (sigma-70 family)
MGTASIERSPGRLSPERERALIRAAGNGDGGARDRLVDAFMPLIGSVARRYRDAGVDRTELMQEGVVGLLAALQRYDPALDTPFWAYASWWVRREMQQLVAQMSRPVVLSDRALRRLARIKHARTALYKPGAGEPSVAELASHTGFPLDQVNLLLAAERAPRGLEEPVGGDDRSATTIGDLLADPSTEESYDRAVESLELRLLRELTAELDERERGILLDHYGFGRPAMTLREIGAHLGLSCERIRQIEVSALKKLRAGLEASPPAIGDHRRRWVQA